MERRDFKSSATVAKLCCLVFFHRRSLSKEVGKKHTIFCLSHGFQIQATRKAAGWESNLSVFTLTVATETGRSFKRAPVYLQLPESSSSLWRTGMCPGVIFLFFFFLALKIRTQYDRKNLPEFGWDALIILCRRDVLVLMLRRNERKPWSREAVKLWSCEVSLRVRQPASRTCPPFGSCPGRRRRAGCSGGVPRPTGQTGAVHSGNSGRSLPWGNPATRDDQTHSLQHTQQRRVTMRKTGRQRNFLANSNSAPLCTVTGGSAQEGGHHAKFKQSREKTIQSGCAAASRWPPQRLISS